MSKSAIKDGNRINDYSTFLESAKDRLKCLERESERIENSFRDYQHKIKSKYYPINEDNESELRIISAKKNIFIPNEGEAFLESTVKTNAKVNQMKQELFEETQKHLNSEKNDELYQKVVNLTIIDEMIKSVPLISREKTETINNPISLKGLKSNL